MDLGASILANGTLELNDAAVVTPGGPIVGCSVDTMDYSRLESRQVLNPYAKYDGLDVGGVWVTSRHITMTGTIYGSTRGDAKDRLEALEAMMTPDSGTYGTITIAGSQATASGGGRILRTLTAVPQGLRWVDRRTDHGGNDDEPLAIQWAVNMIGDPNILTVIDPPAMSWDHTLFLAAVPYPTPTLEMFNPFDNEMYPQTGYRMSNGDISFGCVLAGQNAPYGSTLCTVEDGGLMFNPELILPYDSQDYGWEVVAYDGDPTGEIDMRPAVQQWPAGTVLASGTYTDGVSPLYVDLTGLVLPITPYGVNIYIKLVAPFPFTESCFAQIMSANATGYPYYIPGEVPWTQYRPWKLRFS